MSTDNYLAFVEDLEKSKSAFDQAVTAFDGLETEMEAWIADRQATKGLALKSDVQEFRTFREKELAAARQAAADTLARDRESALEVVRAVETAEETLLPEVVTLDKSASETVRYQARMAEVLERQELYQSLQGATIADVLATYQRAITQKNRMAMRAIEDAHATNWRGLGIVRADSDAVDIMAFAKLEKATREGRRPAWTKEARARITKVWSLQVEQHVGIIRSNMHRVRR